MGHTQVKCVAPWGAYLKHPSFALLHILVPRNGTPNSKSTILVALEKWRIVYLTC